MRTYAYVRIRPRGKCVESTCVDEHVLTSSYERVLICSSRKFYQAYFNKIYSISSGLNGPYEQMSMCS